ncbi:cation transporter [Mycoplasma iguanae]|uniref:Cation transporter n=1 Tax=Mycoplasma iguanae TaxID=292461 RepID=A0ABY5R817_9MOLU|nr:potassium transporter TrkG [Mycoplasma iguanae]UVD81583.1 cation transporter [Mycoplasma iguanae]
MKFYFLESFKKKISRIIKIFNKTNHSLRFNYQRKISKIKWVFIIYFIITISGSLILYSQSAQKEGVSVSYVDALFTSASAFSDTGLTIHPTAHTWTSFGQSIIAILILVGGIGFFALKVYFVNWLFGKKISIFQRNILNVERGSIKVGSTRKIIIVSINILFVFILVSTLVLTFFFYFAEGNFANEPDLISPRYNFLESLKFAVFHSITSLNNAGFDIMGANSIAPYYHSYFLQSWLAILFIFGGIGYPVIYDLYNLVYHKLFLKKEYKISLFSKISISMYFIVAIIGLSLIYAFELTSTDPNSFWNIQKGDPNYWNYDYGSKSDKVFALFFASIATRSAGFYTIDPYNLTSPSLLVMTILMVIGASPSSTGGGIRTTTLAILFLGLWAKMSSKPSVRVFKRKISNDTVINSFIILILSMLLLIFGTMIVFSSSISQFNNMDIGKLQTSIDLSNPEKRVFNMIHVLFEVASAFGTTGISLGVSPLLNISSKLTLIIIMFIGQLGISSTILIWSKHNSRSLKFDYPEEEVLIG